MVLVIPVVLICRFLSAGAVLGIASAWKGDFRLPGLLTWGGLRGGISIALALSVPAIASKELLLDMAYAVVLCSVLVQAPTIKVFFPSESLKQLMRTY
jgi:CPA1 family monovalent cation:H+ antiporter